MKAPRHHVSDFALLQFLELEYGIDVASLRRTVAWRADAVGWPSCDATALTSQELRLHVSGGTVCGVSRAATPDADLP
ncbi:hypothetical protein [Tropicibacter sp. S64]|uniref:hypothetical protein n=1 Tax=Tropicibacter sp. S64 TaxID=3415122 RepID=UPI003C7D5B9B